MSDIEKQSRRWRVVGHEPTAENRKFGHWDIEGDYLIAANLTYDDAAFIIKAINSHNALVEALIPFARCLEQIGEDESEDEWAKFRLTVGDYRRAAAALKQAGAGSHEG